MSDIKVLTADDYAESIASGSVVVDFYADWCGPCKMMAPIVHELADEYDGKIKFYKLNTDDSKSIAASNHVASIPTLLFFKDGEQKDRSSGMLDKAAITEKLGSIL
jgi:thioredoxin 1